MHRLIAMTLVLSFLLAAAGCSLQEAVMSDATTEPIATESTEITIVPIPPTESTQATETTAPVPIQYPLFSEKALMNQPAAITSAEYQTICDELMAILCRKSYDETGTDLIWDTVALLRDRYINFQYLFSFLEPPDTATFLRTSILAPLDVMVDTLTCTQDGTGNGWASDSTKELGIDLSGDRESDCMILIHELNHMVTATEHYLVSSNLYNSINEGDATLHQLTILGGLRYRVMGDVQNRTRRHFDPENDTLCLEVGGFHAGHYADFSLLFFKLLALTDFETMSLFDQPDGEFLIRDALGEKYGADGLAFYDSLTNKLDYASALASESLFLKLFLSRLSEVESAERMLSYLFLYRLYRMSFAPEYLQIETDLIREIPHPQLDYAAADGAVADAVVRWGILNTEALSDADVRLVGLAIAGRTKTINSETYWARHEREFYHPVNPFLLCDAWYICEDDITISFMAELPEGDQIYYFETDLAANLHTMVKDGLLIP